LDANEGSKVGRALLLGTGLLFLAAALLYDPHLFAILVPSWDPTSLQLEKLGRVRLGFAAAGAAGVALAELARRRPALSRWLSRPRIASALLALLGLGVPLALLDGGLRPFVEPKTTLYTADRELGWKLVPGARDEYGGVRIEVNSRGLRGPELGDAKPAGSVRILWLGDSVTFGYGVEPVESVFPFRVAALLSERLGRPLETVDSGVGGYAPWQELAWLEREGWRYAPDLVVVGFVLNDLTEPFSLVRYGGTGEGWQLARAAKGQLDRWLSSSALVSFLREGNARLRFGRDVQRGATARGTLDVQRLVADPDAPMWQRSWRVTESDLTRIFAAARGHGVGVALVIFPYAFQLGAPGPQPAVQRRLVSLAEREGVPVLDLLPVLAARRASQPFLDASHLSEAGHAAVAEALAGFLVERGLVPPPMRQG
jgi:lysophospholipase L1-like esterase